MVEFPFLHTDRLRLVEISEDHIESFFSIMSKEEVIHYYGMERLTQVDEAEQIFRSFQDNFESKRGIRWGMINKENGRFIGTIGLNNLNLYAKKAEIGYELHPDYWRKGLTSEAIREVLRYSFDELDLYRMGAVTFVENDASTYLLKKIGFIKEGVLRGYLYQRQTSHDAFVFSLIQPDWYK